MSEPLFYVLSLKHTKRRDGVLTFWGPNNSNYYFRLNLCGTYTAAQIREEASYYDDGVRTLAVSCEAVRAVAERVGDVRSKGLDWDRAPDDLVVAYEHLVSLKVAHGARKKAAATRRSWKQRTRPTPTVKAP